MAIVAALAAGPVAAQTVTLPGETPTPKVSPAPLWVPQPGATSVPTPFPTRPTTKPTTKPAAGPSISSLAPAPVASTKPKPAATPAVKATPKPAATPAVKATPKPSPTPTVKPVLTPKPTPTRTASPAPSPTPTATATPVAAPTPRPVTALAPLALPEAITGTLPLPALAGIGAFLAAIGGWIWRRRRRAALDIVIDDDPRPAPAAAAADLGAWPDEELPVVEPVPVAVAVAAPPRRAEPAAPSPAPAPAPAPPAPAFTPAPVPGQRGAPARITSPLVVEAVPDRLTISLVMATLRYRLRLANRGETGIDEVIVSGDMIAAHASLPEAEQLAIAGANLPERHRFTVLAAGESAELTGEFRVPLGELAPIQVGNAALFVPLARFHVSGVAAGEAVVEESCVLAVGEPPTAPGAGIRPFRLDLGPRLYNEIAARKLDSR